MHKWLPLQAWWLHLAQWRKGAHLLAPCVLRVTAASAAGAAPAAWPSTGSLSALRAGDWVPASTQVQDHLIEAELFG